MLAGIPFRLILIHISICRGPAGRGGNHDVVFSSYLGGGGPLLLGEELVLVAALDSTSDTVDALVGLAVVEALEGLLGNVVLLLEEIVISVFPQTN